MQTASPRRHTFQPETGSFSGIYSQWTAQRQSDIGLQQPAVIKSTGQQLKPVPSQEALGQKRYD